MVTVDDVRRVALALPETVEKAYNRRPGFRVRSTLFLRIHELPDTMMVGCAGVPERDELLLAEPSAFFITPHYRDYPAVLVRLGAIDQAELAELACESWRLNAPRRLLAAYDAEHPPRAY